MSAFFRDVNDWLANPAVFVLAVLAAWALAVIALTAIGRRLERRTQIKRWKAAWREAQARGGHPVILAPTSFQEDAMVNLGPTESEPTPDEVRQQVQRVIFDALRSASSPPAQTTEQAKARQSAAKCPSRHRNAVPVNTFDGEIVAALCPDCGEQLPPEAAPAAPEDYSDIEAEHEADYHGYWSVFRLAYRLCAEECNPHLAARPPTAPPFTPDPRLTEWRKE